MQPHAQTLPTLIVIDDRHPQHPLDPEQDISAYLHSLWHWEQMPCEEETEDTGYFLRNSDEQEWRDDYIASIRL